MSTILKALRRLEEERAARGPELPLERELARSEGAEIAGRRRRRTIVLGSAAAGALVLVGAFFWGLASQEREGPEPRLATRREPPRPAAPARSLAAAPREQALPGLERRLDALPSVRTVRPEAEPLEQAPAAEPARRLAAGSGEPAGEARAAPPGTRMPRLLPMPGPATPGTGGPADSAAGARLGASTPPAPEAAPPRAAGKLQVPAPAPQVAAVTPSLPRAAPAHERREPAAPMAEQPKPVPAPPQASPPPRAAPLAQAPAPSRATSPPPPAGAVARPPDAPRPVARRPAPVEVARGTLPEVLVTSTVWHPDPDRRLAIVELAGRQTPLRLRQGDAVGSLIVGEIELSGVVFLHGGVEVRRKVGRRP